MTWKSCQGNWAEEPVPKNECDLYHCVEGLLGKDAPTGPMSIVMASIIRYCGLKVVVELGVYHGGTTIFLADACRDTGGRLFCIDLSDCFEARTRIRDMGLEKNCIFYNECSWSVSSPTSVDLLFIDAGHSKENITFDWMTWYPRVRKGGWIFIDNTSSERGVQEFMFDLMKNAKFKEECQYVNCDHSFGMAIIKKRECDDVEYFGRRIM